MHMHTKLKPLILFMIEVSGAGMISHHVHDGYHPLFMSAEISLKSFTVSHFDDAARGAQTFMHLYTA